VKKPFHWVVMEIICKQSSAPGLGFFDDTGTGHLLCNLKGQTASCINGSSEHTEYWDFFVEFYTFRWLSNL